MLLQLHGVCKRYGATPVLRNVDLSVQSGEFVGVIGPNGAGKTTLFGLIAGNLACDSGRIELDGRDLTRQRAQQRCHSGIARTFQVPQPFETLTVYENALVSATFGAELQGAQAARAAATALNRCGLLRVADHPAATLGLLQRKRLELARALATQPRLLLLDEVAGGLTDREMVDLVQLVRELHAEGVTVLWIEHLVHALVPVAQRLVVLAEGQLLADGPPATVIINPQVRETYLGTDFDVDTPASPREAKHAAH